MNKAHLTVLLVSLSAWSCGGSYDFESPSSQCAKNTAIIAVHDGFLQNLCGCNEPDGTLYKPPQEHSCTVTAPTAIRFEFSSVHLDHQIISQGTPAFVSSRIVKPDDEGNPAPHVISLDEAGTYSFKDIFFPDVVGKIIAQ